MKCPNCGDRVDPPYRAEDEVRHVVREETRRYLVIAVGDAGTYLLHSCDLRD